MQRSNLFVSCFYKKSDDSANSSAIRNMCFLPKFSEF